PSAPFRARSGACRADPVTGSRPARPGGANPAAKTEKPGLRPGFSASATSVLPRRFASLFDDDLRPDLDAVVKVDDVLVDEADAARRHRPADRVPFRRTVQAVAGVAALVEQVERAGAER